MESYNKLVRDKIPEILDAKGVIYEARTASLEEFKMELIKKLDEEVREFVQDGSVGELADILEVVESLKTFPEYGDVEKIRLQKREDRGGFDKRIIAKGKK